MARRRLSLPFHRAYGTTIAGGGLALRIGRLLEAPHGAKHNPHWSVTNRERRQWAAAVRAAIPPDYPAGDEQRRMRLIVVREVPHRRWFIQDRDNLVWSTKRLRDALKGAGLIKDDSMKWLEFPDPEQQVSGDGLPWTVIILEPCEVSTDVQVRPRPRALQGRQAPHRAQPRGPQEADR